MKLKRIVLPVVFFLILSCSRAKSVEVEKVIDGDSFSLKGGQEVRLLGIDAPEYGKPGANISKDYLEKALSCGKITLKSSGDDMDKYGRLLRYVYADDILINREMIEKGYALAKYIIPGEKHSKDFLSLQQEAEASGKGLWPLKVFSSGNALKDGVVSWKDVHDYYGKKVTVQGKIVRAYNSGKACFLNFHQDWKKHFTVVIFAKDFSKFSNPPETFYLDKKVMVRGKVKEYKGAPEIIVGSPEQIEIIK